MRPSGNACLLVTTAESALYFSPAIRLNSFIATLSKLNGLPLVSVLIGPSLVQPLTKVLLLSNNCICDVFVGIEAHEEHSTQTANTPIILLIIPPFSQNQELQYL